MSPAIAPRDYSLIGRDARLAVERGLAAAQWYSSPISRKELKQLMQRRDGPAIRDTCLWMGAMIMSGALGVYLWGGFAAAPFSCCTAFSMARAPTAAGMSAAMARRFAPVG